MIEELYYQSVELLKLLISTPSHSREEDGTAAILFDFLKSKGVDSVSRHGNNVWAVNQFFDESKPTILLNSHHDTVKPSPSYSRNPYLPTIEDGKLYGLGSNDAGASVVSLIALFLHLYRCENLKYNLCLALSAEEEVSGRNGIESLLPLLPPIEFALVGEPTLMDMAIAERGLMVVDCTAKGTTGHAARNEGVNAIYKALDDIVWFRDFKFEKSSQMLGDVKMSVTIIGAGTQHNVVPAECKFTVDIRVADCYTNEEVLEIIRKNVSCDVEPRSVRLRPSSIPSDHPFVKRAMEMGRKTFGSPTLSDQALMQMPSLKMGVGDSARSHSADEFIYLHEIKEGIETYIKIFESLIISVNN